MSEAGPPEAFWEITYFKRKESWGELGWSKKNNDIEEEEKSWVVKSIAQFS